MHSIGQTMISIEISLQSNFVRSMFQRILVHSRSRIFPEISNHWRIFRCSDIEATSHAFHFVWTHMHPALRRYTATATV